MREVTGYVQGTLQTYIPMAFGNREDPEPIIVEYQVPTEREKRAIYAKGAGAIRFSGAIELAVAESLAWQHHAVESQLRYIGNAARTKLYRVRGFDIKTGKDLVEYGEGKLLAEIAAEITTGFSFSEQEKKHSDAPLESSLVATLASDGIVETAVTNS